MSQTLVYSTKDYADYLKHAGVKGMKWGVRKDKDKPKSKSTTTIDTTKPKVKIKEEEPAAGGGGGKANTEEDDKRELEAINEVLESGRDMKFKEFTTLLRRRAEIQERMDARNKPDDEKSSSRKEPTTLDKVPEKGISLDKLVNLNSDLTTEERIARGRKRRLEREKRNGSAKHGDLLSVKMKDISPDYLAHYQASIDLDDYLMHYGVKGMKWGVRKDDRGKIKSVVKRTPLRGKNEKGPIRDFLDSNDHGGTRNHKAVARAYKTARPYVKQGLRNLNKDERYRDKDLTNEKSKLVKQYHQDVSDMVTSKLNMAAVVKAKRGDKLVPAMDYNVGRSNEPQIRELNSHNQFKDKGTKRAAKIELEKDMNVGDAVLQVGKGVAKRGLLYAAASQAVGTGIIAATGLELIFPEYSNPITRSISGYDGPIEYTGPPRRVRHSDDEESGLTIVFDPIMDEMGHITDVTFDVINPTIGHADLLSVKMKDISPNYLAHYQDAIDLDDYLMHHGIKGMKWGVRRTPEQLGHRVSKAGSSLKKKVRSVAGADARTKRKIARTRRKARVEVAKLNAERAVANAKAKQEADAKKRGESSPQSKPGSSTQTTAISKRKGTAGLSDDELRYAVSRMNLEKNYAQLIAESTPKTNKQKFNAWAKKTAISTLETQAKAIINQAAGNTTKKLFAAVSATADEVKDGPKPQPQQPKPKQQSQPKPQPQPQPQPKPKEAPKPKPQPTPPPKTDRAQFGKVSEEAWQRYKANGPPPPRTSSWRDGPSVIRDNIDEPIGSVLELYDPRRRR